MVGEEFAADSEESPKLSHKINSKRTQKQAAKARQKLATNQQLLVSDELLNSPESAEKLSL